MKLFRNIVLISIVLIAVLCSGCLTNPDKPKQEVINHPPITQTPDVIQEKPPEKHAKMQGSFVVGYSDFGRNNSTRLIAEDGFGNTIYWMTENNSSGATIKLTYYGKEVQTYVQRNLYNGTQSIGYSCDEKGYEINTGTSKGTTKRTVLIKGEWGK